MHRYRLSNEQLDRILLDGFEHHRTTEGIRRSHLFNGRYENIYLTRNEIPELAQLVTAIKEIASDILGTDELRYGLWFNDMPPGATTTLHNHDNEDELLSCVYYLKVPEGSGDFIIHEEDGIHRITPSAGDLFFFPPDRDHEVTENKSDNNRLSIAINFGPPLED